MNSDLKELLLNSRSVLENLLAEKYPESLYADLSAEEMIDEINDILRAMDLGQQPDWLRLGVLFAPTGSFQELALGSRFEDVADLIADRFDELVPSRSVGPAEPNPFSPPDPMKICPRAVLNRMQVVTGDITDLDVDCVVTAANSSLCGGGGVDGAVHRAAGPELLAASRSLAPCPAGGAVITPGFKLRARYVIHAVGPIFSDLQRDSQLLANAYKSSLELACEKKLVSMAFPCISTGVYGFPKPQACSIAVETVSRFLSNHVLPKQVLFCCFSAEDADLYRCELADSKND